MEEQRDFHSELRAKGTTEFDVVEGSDPVKKMKIGEGRRREKGIPLECDCGLALTLETSRSPKTRGEREFRCGYDIYGGGEGCGFRMLWEDAVLDELEKISDEKHALEERLDAANKRIDKQEGRIHEMEMQYEEVMAERKQLDDYDGELSETQLGLAEMRDKHSALVRKVDLLEMKYEKLNKLM